MANCFLGYPNKADVATLSGGSWSGSMPLNNLKDRQIGLKARSTDDALASTRFEADFGDVIAVNRLNLDVRQKYAFRVKFRQGGIAVATGIDRM